MAWGIDPAHTRIEFAIKHMMISTVRGNFGKFGGAVKVDPTDLNKSGDEGYVDVATISTGSEQRDGGPGEERGELAHRSGSLRPKWAGTSIAAPRARRDALRASQRSRGRGQTKGPASLRRGGPGYDRRIDSVSGARASR